MEFGKNALSVQVALCSQSWWRRSGYKCSRVREAISYHFYILCTLVTKRGLLFQTREGEPVEEEEWSVSFQSKYIHFCEPSFLLEASCKSLSLSSMKRTCCVSLHSAVPLYQDYCLQAVKNELHSLDRSFLSDLITTQGLQFRLGSSSHSENTSPRSHSAEAAPPSPSAHPIRVTPCTLWQDLDEVKASGLLSSLTTREIRLQEVRWSLFHAFTET